MILRVPVICCIRFSYIWPSKIHHLTHVWIKLHLPFLCPNFHLLYPLTTILTICNSKFVCYLQINQSNHVYFDLELPALNCSGFPWTNIRFLFFGLHVVWPKQSASWITVHVPQWISLTEYFLRQKMSPLIQHWTTWHLSHPRWLGWRALAAKGRSEQALKPTSAWPWRSVFMRWVQLNNVNALAQSN